jgi:ribosomal protein S18 acetylase RimI-like enzyme
MLIRKYEPGSDEAKVMQMLRDQGDEWKCYWTAEHCAKYRDALRNSITYVACENDEICGYSRSLDDCGFYIYVCDLLVKPAYRGRSLGRALMDCLCQDFPGQTVFVMSDVDEYYRKQGYRKEGSVFEVTVNQGG